MGRIRRWAARSAVKLAPPPPHRAGLCAQSRSPKRQLPTRAPALATPGRPRLALELSPPPAFPCNNRSPRPHLALRQQLSVPGVTVGVRGGPALPTRMPGCNVAPLRSPPRLPRSLHARAHG
ncbi:hypothetical protein ZWY2020_051764 [Hordeum vulgare]|nr:hypothetical protein ZWY2020_051764 [Hordeum vulgare]